MSGSLDMSLEALIRNNKKPGGQDGNSRSRGSGPGPARRLVNRAPTRSAPYSTRQEVQVRDPLWRQELVMAEGSGSESGTKLYVSNLDYEVSNEDIKVLFSEVGDLRRYSLHYDRSGRSKGTAEVVFVRQSDALAAIKRYNNVQLDGKPMKIELVGVNLVTPPVLPPTDSILGNPRGSYRSGEERPSGRGLVRGGSGSGSGSSRGFGRSRGRGRDPHRGDKKTAQDLDAELEKYHLEAMQIN